MKAESAPFLFLLTGTLLFGRAFSILGLTFQSMTIYITEITLGFYFFLLCLRPKQAFSRWKVMLKPDLVLIFAAYLAIGTIHLIFGLLTNGPYAFRDIVFCHYGFIFLIVLFIFFRLDHLAALSRLMQAAMSIVVLIGILIYVLQIPSHSTLIRFISATKGFNWGLILGLTAIIVLSYFFFKPGGKLLKGLLIHFSLLLVLLTFVRAVWAGLAVSLIFLAFLIKKEIAILALFIPLIWGSLTLLDQLSQRRPIISQFQAEWEGTVGKKQNIPRMNMEWRISIWDQTLKKIKQKPLFGWGFGSFPEYEIRKKTITNIVGIGPGSGIIPPHNHLLAVTYKTGILGLLLFLYINIRVFFLGLFHLRDCRSDFLRRMLTACLAGLIYWHGIAFFFDILESPPTGIILWILLGIIISIVYVGQSPEPKSASHVI